MLWRRSRLSTSSRLTRRSGGSLASIHNKAAWSSSDSLPGSQLKRPPMRSGEYVPLSVLASAYIRGSRYDDAERTFERALALLESQGLETDRSAANMLTNWSLMLQQTGQMTASVEKSKRAVAISRAADSENGAIT